MGWTEIRDEISRVISEVDGIENVQHGKRGVIDPTEWINTYRETDTGTIQAWFLYRRGVAVDSADTSKGRGQVPLRNSLWRRHRFELTGFHNFTDNMSEDRFNDLLDSVLDAFNNERSLTALSATPLEIFDIDLYSFSGVYCHRVILNTTVTEWIQGLEPH